MSGAIVFILIVLAVTVVVLTAALAHELTHPPRRTAAWAVARGLASDPAGLGFAFTEWTFETDGARLPVWDITPVTPSHAPSEGRLRSGAVIVLHDHGESRTMMLERCRRLGVCSHRMVLFDRRGHGDAATAARPGGVDVDDLAALVARLDAGPIDIVGFGLGGTIALALRTLSLPIPPLRRVIAVDPWPSSRSWMEFHVASRGLPAPVFVPLVGWFLRFIGARPLAPMAAAPAFAQLQVVQTNLGGRSRWTIEDAAKRMPPAQMHWIAGTPEETPDRLAEAIRWLLGDDLEADVGVAAVTRVSARPV
jgi:pimeloyl-ACP methyl ester carboxylesterase